MGNVSRVAGLFALAGLFAMIVVGLEEGFAGFTLGERTWVSAALAVAGIVGGSLMVIFRMVESKDVLLLLSLAVLGQFAGGLFAGLNTVSNNLGTALNNVVTNLGIFAGSALFALAVGFLVRKILSWGVDKGD